MSVLLDEDSRDEMAAIQVGELNIPLYQRCIANALVDAFGCFKTTVADEQGIVPVYQSFVCVSGETTTLYCIEYGPLVLSKDTDLVDYHKYIREFGNTWVGKRIAMVANRLDKMRSAYTLHKLKNSDHSYCLVNRSSINHSAKQDGELAKHFLFRRIICTTE